MSGSYLAFSQEQLVEKYGTGAGYNEFLRRRGMSLGLFVLPVGAVDRQHPHMADEVYIVLEGRGTLEVVDGPPTGGKIPELEGTPSAFAPDYAPEEMFEIATKLYKKSR